MLRITAALTLISNWITRTYSLGSGVPPTKIQVCQNKGCVKNFPSKYDGGLVQNLKDLIPTNPHDTTAITIEASGCLAQCNNGPNVCCMTNKSDDSSERIFGKVDGIQMAAAVMEVGADVDTPGILMAAVEDMALAHQTMDNDKKIKILSKAIESLQRADLSQTTAMAHALILRADAYMDFIPRENENIQQSLKDSVLATEIDDLSGRAWRVIADAKEANGDIPGAIEAISTWATRNPTFVVKAKKELARLSANGGPGRPQGGFEP